MKCRILSYRTDDGPANMALDEAMLEQAARDSEFAYLRTYGWSVPTLTLGYFQRVADARMEPRWADVPLTRRPTGGGAIWHQHELTYALALPSGHPAIRRNQAIHHAVHGAILQVLRDQGLLEGRRHGDPDGTPELATSSQAAPLLCFADRDAEDLVFRGFKVVGSAQRKRRGAILQHGSILLESTDRTPELRGIRDLAMAPRSPEFWSVLIERSLADTLELEAAHDDPPAEILHTARELETGVYRSPGWLERR